MKRLVYAYLIGLAACVISILVAYRPQAGRWNFLFVAVLGISSRLTGAAGRPSDLPPAFVHVRIRQVTTARSPV